jgi:hypothetical protein
MSIIAAANLPYIWAFIHFSEHPILSSIIIFIYTVFYAGLFGSVPIFVLRGYFKGQSTTCDDVCGAVAGLTITIQGSIYMVDWLFNIDGTIWHSIPQLIGWPAIFILPAIHLAIYGK